MMNTYDGNPLSERWLREQLRETVQGISMLFPLNSMSAVSIQEEKVKITHNITLGIKQMELSSEIEC